ncbi:ECF RNA polymerase sigma-E factor [Planctomycetes bacterium Pan216]|uniref:RNA polymerase sigma factor n=1 Tax=Kolteria novifilia TaxID=2527975 RepID=A0A518B0J5_9BACT|nr:ECF RNA polymerase sigma-E factor [Planctomycetes bacterium Pan216]
MLSDDQDLVDRCLAGDEIAYRDFVERYQELIHGVCYRLLRDRHEAEDVAQEVFLRAIRALDRWDSRRPLRPWILTIAINRCRTCLGRRGRRPTPSEYPEMIADPRSDSGESHLDANELDTEIRVAVDSLREDQRQAFLLFHEQGLSYEEISDALATPIGTLKTWVHRSRKRILDHLKDKGFAEVLQAALACGAPRSTGSQSDDG